MRIIRTVTVGLLTALLVLYVGARLAVRFIGMI